MRATDVRIDSLLQLTRLAGDPEDDEDDAGNGDLDEDDLDEEDDWEDVSDDEEEGWRVGPTPKGQPLPIDFVPQSS